MKVAILGLGNIAKRVAVGINEANNAQLYAVASHDKNKAETFKNEFHACVAYDSYEKMFEDNEVELVYICTPNHLHYEHIKMCIQYNKHVLCEKPLVSNALEVEELFAYANENGCFLMEAEKTLFTPLNKKIKEMIDDGVIGKLLSVKADYCYNILEEQLDKSHWTFNDKYGGCSYDVGVYPICFANYYASSDIYDVKANVASYQDFICDFNMCANIIYQNGVIATVNSSWLYETPNKGCGYLFGETGYIEIPAFWKGKEAYLISDGKKEKISVNMNSDFTGEIEHAIDCINHGLLESPLLNKQASLEIMKVLEVVNQYRKR